MSSYPIISQTPLTKANRVGKWHLGPRRRPVDEIPTADAHEVVVYKSGGSYFLDDGRSRPSDDHVVNATSVSVVNMRENAPVTVSVPIPSAGAAEFTVHVTFLCTVRRAEDVVDAGLKDMADPLRQYLVRHQPLFHVGEEFELDEISAVRRNVTSEVKAYVSVRPPWFRGIEVALGSVQVLTPEEVIAFESERRGRRRSHILASEGEFQDHALDQERRQHRQISDLTKQRDTHDLARQAEINARELAGLQQQLFEQQDQLRRRHEEFMAELRQESDHRREARQLDHSRRLRAERFAGAIEEADKLKIAIGAGESDLPTVVATAAGEHTLAETAELLNAERRQAREAQASDALRRESWAREDRRANWGAEREDVNLAHKLKVAQLRAQVDIINAGIARGLADPMTIEKVLRTLDGAAKELEGDADAVPPFRGPDDEDLPPDVHEAVVVVNDADSQYVSGVPDSTPGATVAADGTAAPERAFDPDDSGAREEDSGP